MNTGADRGRARGRALCVWAVAAVLWAGGTAARADCPADRIDEYVRVRHVHDGDTVELSDGRRLRFIGINTPELARDGRPAEPLAKAARDALRGLLKTGGRLGLRYDRERRDRYGRLLAHVYLDPAHSVTARLLADGYGAVVAVPPNLWNLACYRREEAAARRAGRGLWGLAYYRPLSARRLPRHAQGFRLVTGRVSRVGESRHSLWLNLEGGMALRIARKDLIYFRGFDAARWQGRRVEARGWLRLYRGRPVMQIRHPFMLRALTGQD